MNSAYFIRPAPQTRGDLLAPALPFPCSLFELSSPPPTHSSPAFAAQSRLLRRCDPSFAPRRPCLSDLTSPANHHFPSITWLRPPSPLTSNSRPVWGERGFLFSFHRLLSELSVSVSS